MRYFFMTKYSTELKIEIVSKYLNHEDSIKGLAKQYNIHWTLIRRWIDRDCKIVCVRMNDSLNLFL